jgi:hypothetical protein
MSSGVARPFAIALLCALITQTPSTLLPPQVPAAPRMDRAPSLQATTVTHHSAPQTTDPVQSAGRVQLPPADEAARAPCGTLANGQDGPLCDLTLALRRDIEHALASSDAREREHAFATLLPELVARDSAAVAQMVEACDAGAVCDELLARTVDAWTGTDAEGALRWIESLPENNRRRDAAALLTSQMARFDRGMAFEAAERLNYGRDDGTLEHLMQVWVAENPAEAQRWLEAQPPGAQRDQLLARFNFARAKADSAAAP